jgi:putative membrane protein
MKTFTLIIFATAFLYAGCGHSGNGSTSTGTYGTRNDSTAVMKSNGGNDNDFVMEAANGGMMEVDLGKYAQQNAMNPRVKEFGAMMERDHSKANNELKALATSKNITLPSNMDDNKMVNDLKSKKGADFDKDYIDAMVKDHKEDIDKFKKQSTDGSDADIKSFASNTLGVLQTHLDSALSIQKSLK